jgi:hypothetical protein
MGSSACLDAVAKTPPFLQRLNHGHAAYILVTILTELLRLCFFGISVAHKHRDHFVYLLLIYPKLIEYLQIVLLL